MHFGSIALDVNGNKDLYTITAAAFRAVVCGNVCVMHDSNRFHLSHGFASAFQSIGANHAKYSPIIKKVSCLWDSDSTGCNYSDSTLLEINQKDE